MDSKDYSTSMASHKPSTSNSSIPNIKEGSVHSIGATKGEGSDSSVSFKDAWSKENILIFNDRSPFRKIRRPTESRASCESGVFHKSDWSRTFIPDYKDRSPLKVISQDCSPARSRGPIPNYQERSSHRALVEDSLSPGISFASVKRDNAQGRFANVKETLPSPKKKSDFNISQKEEDTVADVKDLVKCADDQMAKESLESIDSGVSFESDRSKHGLIHFIDRVSPSRSDLSFSEEENVKADDEDLVESSDSQISVKSGELSDSSLSFKSDHSKDFIIDFKDRPPLSSQELSTSDLEDTVNDEEPVESSDDELDKTVTAHGV